MASANFADHRHLFSAIQKTIVNFYKNIFIYFLCFSIAFYSPFVFASAAEDLNFRRLENFARTSYGYVADYVFSAKASNDPTYNAANDDVYVRNHSVDNKKLGKTAFNRILGIGGVVGLAFTIAEVVNLLNEDGWVVDVPNQEIYKLEPNGLWCPVLVGYNACFGTPEQAAQEYCNEYTRKYPSSSCAVGSEVSRTNSRVTYVRILNGNQSANITVNRKDGTLKILATPDDVADVLPRASDAQIRDLATSQDYLGEPHEPTIDAANKANPANAKCPAGTVRDIVKQTCIGADNGVKPKTDPQGNPQGFELPEFCSWAMPVCDVIEWVKSEPKPENAQAVQVKDKTSDAQNVASQILTLGFLSNRQPTCPANFQTTWMFMGRSVDFEISYQPLCDMLETARPVVISLAYFQAVKIVFLGRRD